MNNGDLISRQSVLNACEQSINILEAVDRIMDLPSVKPQVSCGDAVSRQAALDAMYELCNTGETLEENPWRDNPHIDAITDAINNLPPVKPQEPSGETVSLEAFKQVMWERDIAIVQLHELGYGLGQKIESKTGHWIQTNESFINQDGQFIYNFICSKCKSLSYFRKSNKKAIGANVCPNCGAKMIEPQESEEQECTKKI